jgi:hypothetical protein
VEKRVEKEWRKEREKNIEKRELNKYSSHDKNHRLISKITFFSNANLLVVYLAFFCYGLSSFPVAFILSTFAKTPTRANIKIMNIVCECEV